MSHRPESNAGGSPSTVDGYTLRWHGDVLVIHPDCWCGYLNESPEEYERRQRIVPIVEAIQPRAILFDLHGVKIMPAALTGILVRIGKLVDFTRQHGRLAVVECDPGVREYFRMNHLDWFIEFRD